MTSIKRAFREKVQAAAKKFIAEKTGAAPAALEIAVCSPPDASMGDIGAPMFALAKALKTPPALIAKEVAGRVEGADALGKFSAVGPYVNLSLKRDSAAFSILSRIKKEGDGYGSFGDDGKKPLDGRRVMVEFSSPNTNKPLHLGHLRNDALGESVSRILRKAGAEVFKVDLINDRGVHICKSMLAYKLFHEAHGDTPESLGMKGDHFAGQCYVEFDKYSRSHPEAAESAEEMLALWEKGDEETRSLWRTMNKWTIDGIKETYRRTGVSFDKFYLESETYLLGKKIIEKGLADGIFFKASDGSVRVDITDVAGKDKDGGGQSKVLLRSDGTSVYITQDIGTAVSRRDDWPYDQMIYVVASEQNRHFKVLFHILRKLGFSWTDDLRHLSYGLVNLPEGRMKSREGTVVDADDLLDSLRDDALAQIKSKGREDEVGDARAVAEKIALSALHYYLLHVAPAKDMLFNPKESLSFEGDTGPYIQYMGARIASILRKAEEGASADALDEKSCALLSSDEEWALVKALGRYPETVEACAAGLDPSALASYLHDLCKRFGKFYEACPIMGAPSAETVSARLSLARATLSVLKSAMDLLLIPFVEKM